MNAHKFVAYAGWLVTAIVFSSPIIERSVSPTAHLNSPQPTPQPIAYRGSGRIVTDVDQLMLPI